MEFKEGYVYHIKDSYFEKVKDDKLMKNKESGNFRPTFYCFKDKQTSLLWVVPLSSRVDKYKSIMNKQIERYGNSMGIYIGTFDGKPSVFLIQNMFPITEEYLDHVHTRNGNPVPVKQSISKEVKSRMQRTLQLISRGKKVVFPNIERLKNLMLEEIKQKSNSKDLLKTNNKKTFTYSRKRLQESADKISNDKTQNKNRAKKKEEHKI